MNRMVNIDLNLYAEPRGLSTHKIPLQKTKMYFIMYLKDFLDLLENYFLLTVAFIPKLTYLLTLWYDSTCILNVFASKLTVEVFLFKFRQWETEVSRGM